MPSTPPRSYDDIVRGTVPDLDSSARPTRAQEKEAREGFRAMDDAEKVLYGRASDALLGTGVPLGSVQIEVNRGTVTLRGQVPDIDTVRRVEQRVRDVEGIDAVDNKLVVTARG